MNSFAKVQAVINAGNEKDDASTSNTPRFNRETENALKFLCSCMNCGITDIMIIIKSSFETEYVDADSSVSEARRLVRLSGTKRMVNYYQWVPLILSLQVSM